MFCEEDESGANSLRLVGRAVECHQLIPLATVHPADDDVIDRVKSLRTPETHSRRICLWY